MKASRAEADALMERLFGESKRSLRPSMDQVAAAIELLFTDASMADYQFKQVEGGPDRWRWADALDKTLTLERASRPGHDDDGYPTMTIRQPIAPALGSYLTSSAYAIGKDVTSLTTCLTSLWVNHWGAYNGLMATAKGIVLGGGLSAGADVAEAIHRIGEDATTSEEVKKGMN